MFYFHIFVGTNFSKEFVCIKEPIYSRESSLVWYTTLCNSLFCHFPGWHLTLFILAFYYIYFSSFEKTCNYMYLGGGVFEWITCQTSIQMITSSMGSNPVRGKLLFPWARNFILIAQYWLVPGTDLRVFL